MINKRYFAAHIVLLISSMVGIIEGAPVIPIAGFLFMVIGYLFLNREQEVGEERKFIESLYYYGFFLRMLFAVFLYYWLIYSHGDCFLGDYTDDRGYEFAGNYISMLWKNKDFIIPYQFSRHPGYPVIIALAHYFGEMCCGYHHFIPLFINILFGSLLSVYVYKYARDIFGVSVARVAGLLAMIYPDFLYYSSVQLRDILIVFIFMYASVKMIGFSRTNRVFDLLWAILGVVVVYYLRTSYGYVLMYYLLVLYLAKRYGQNSNVSSKAFYGGIALLTLVVLFVLSNISLDHSFIFDNIEGRRLHSIASANRVESSLGITLLTHLPLYVSVVVLPVVNFIMPYPPWAYLYNYDDLMYVNFVLAIGWTALIPLVVSGVSFGFVKRRYESLLVILPAIIVLIVSGVGNFTARYKLEAVPFFLIFASLGILRFRNNKKYWFYFYLIIQYALFIAYVGAKIIL